MCMKVPKYPLNLPTYRSEYHKSYEYLRDRIIDQMVKKKEKKEIRAKSLELSDESAELYDELSTIQFQLCEKYGLLYQSLTVS